MNKRCSRCKIEKSFDRFNKQARAADGLNPWCKDCRREYDRLRYQANPESARARSRSWNKANPERHRANVKRWQRENLDELARRRRTDRQSRPDHYKQVRGVWEDANREALNQRMRDWRKLNPDYARRAYWSNPENARDKSARRRACRAGARSIPFTVEQLEARLAYYGFRCWICRAPWEHLDHVKPLSKGGPHMLSNLRPACAECNLSKGSQWPFDTTNRRGPRDSSNEVHQSRA